MHKREREFQLIPLNALNWRDKTNWTVCHALILYQN